MLKVFCPASTGYSQYSDLSITAMWLKSPTLLDKGVFDAAYYSTRRAPERVSLHQGRSEIIRSLKLSTSRTLLYRGYSVVESHGAATTSTHTEFSEKNRRQASFDGDVNS